MSEVIRTIDVGVDVGTAYGQWARFEEFPVFMGGVERVEQLDDHRLRWLVQIAGFRRTFDTEITERRPDQRLAWTSTNGVDQSGVVTFHPLPDDRTRVTLQVSFRPRGLVEHVGDILGVVDRKTQGDLDRFKDFIEGQDAAAGGWQGTVEPA